MKKTLVILLTIIMVLSMAEAAQAAGKLVSVKENFYAIPYYTSGVYATIYAEVANEGDKPVEFANGLVEFFDKDGNSIESADIGYCYPAVLQPGGHGFIYASKYVETTDLMLITDHMLSLTGKGKITQNTVPLEASAKLETTSDTYYPTTRVISLVTNNTDKPITEIDMAFAIKDAEGNILFVNSVGWDGYNISLMPGSSLQIVTDLYSDTVTFFTNNNLVPATVDCAAYTALRE